jgi:hypothetical protein
MEPNDQENLHRWLDRALVEYGNTEPRSGLEARVLANLSAERERITARQRWFWALTLTATAAVIILAVWMESNTGLRINIPTQTSTASELQAQSKQRPVEMAKPDVFQRSRKISSPRVDRNRTVHSFETAAAPKLDRFPSSQPPSEQERLLLAYLKETPTEELMLAIVKAKSNEDLRVKDLDIQSLEHETPASESSERN